MSAEPISKLHMILRQTIEVKRRCFATHARLENSPQSAVRCPRVVRLTISLPCCIAYAAGHGWRPCPNAIAAVACHVQSWRRMPAPAPPPADWRARISREEFNPQLQCNIARTGISVQYACQAPPTAVIYAMEARR